MDRTRFVATLNDYVDPHRIPDHAPTGLQVSGRDTIRRVALAVSANMESARAAIEWSADALVVHHGMFWEPKDPENDPARAFDERRATVMKDHGLNLVAYHLPLDAHLEVGNNVEIVRRLGFELEATDFAPLAGTDFPIGVIARAPLPLTHRELAELVERTFGQPAVIVAAGPERLSRFGIVSGGGMNEFYPAIDRGVDAFLTGEGREWVAPVAREAGVTFVSAGHHATEQFGVQALGRWITENLGLETRFFPQSNPF